MNRPIRSRVSTSKTLLSTASFRPERSRTRDTRGRTSKESRPSYPDNSDHLKFIFDAVSGSSFGSASLKTRRNEPNSNRDRLRICLGLQANENFVSFPNLNALFREMGKLGKLTTLSKTYRLDIFSGSYFLEDSKFGYSKKKGNFDQINNPKL